MHNIILSDTLASRGLTPLFVGHQACESEHSFGPYVRDYYLLHFCIRGRGMLSNRHGEHTVHGGQLFVIRPGELTTYIADKQDPWEYVWVAFRGESAGVFVAEPSVYCTPHGIDTKLLEYVKNDILAPEIYISILFELIYFLFCEPPKNEISDKIRRIRRYIQYNYMLPLTVEGLAKSFGFERSYLYRMFKQHYGVGVKEYIVEVRMRCAQAFLARGCRVNECAHLVGYDDEFNFSKTFKKHFGIPPSSLCHQADQKEESS